MIHSHLSILAMMMFIALGATVFSNTGMAITSLRVIGTALYCAWGTGAGTSAATDITLFTEDTTAGYARVSATLTQKTTTVTNDTVQAVATIICQASGGLTITNAGLFDASTAGNLYEKGDFTGIPLALNDSIQFTFTLQYT